jgi:hypothetical protein
MTGSVLQDQEFVRNVICSVPSLCFGVKLMGWRVGSNLSRVNTLFSVRQWEARDYKLVAMVGQLTGLHLLAIKMAQYLPNPAFKCL